MQKLVLASGNSGKLREFAELLAPLNFQLVPQADFAVPEADEPHPSFIENALAKARHAARLTGLPALADDSGIECDGLNGAPGVYTADWAETPQGRDFHMAMRKTWEALEAANAPHPRTARFRSTLVLAWPDGEDEVFEGKVEGQVVWPMRGAHGHGYDPMFQPDGYQITFGEMDPDEKNRISHRADAFRKLVTCFGG